VKYNIKRKECKDIRRGRKRIFLCGLCASSASSAVFRL